MSTPPALPALDSTLGAIVIGAALATFLLGIATLQAFNYSQKCEKDALLLRAAVGAVWLLEVAHSIVVWHTAYSMTVTFYGQPEHLANPPHTIELNLIFAYLIEFIVAAYYSHRIRVLSHSNLIPAICMLLTIGRTIIGFTMVPIFWLGSGFGEFRTNDTLRALMMTSFIVAPAVDTLTACTLCYHLAQARKKTLGGTRKIVGTLIAWAIESMLLTSLVSIIQLILFLSMNENLVWIPFYLCEAKLASNSLLAQLNGREKLRGTGNSVHVIDDLERGQNQSSVVIRMHTMTQTQKSVDGMSAESERPHGSRKA